MQCRACGIETQCRARADLTYYECPGCGGLWFNQGELESMISRKVGIPLSARPSGPSADIEQGGGGSRPQIGRGDCPSCGPEVRLIPMTTYATRRAKILGCPVCFGHWLSRDQALVLIEHVCYRGLVGRLRKLFRRRLP